MLRRIRLLSLWCVLVLLVGVAPAVAANDPVGPAEVSASPGSVEPAAVLVAEPGDEGPVVLGPDPVVPVWVEEAVPALPDPDAGRAGVVSASGSVALAADEAAAVDGVPVSVELTEGRASEAQVTLLAGSEAAGVSSLSLAVWVDLEDPAASDAETETASARVVFDYSDLRLGYAAGLMGRLGLARGEGCKTDEEGVLGCEELTPVPAVNDRLARTLTFDMQDSDLRPAAAADPMPAMTAGEAAVSSEAEAVPVVGSGGGGWFVLLSGPSGEGGSFSATPLPVLSSYQVGLQSGSFELSYPIGVPPAFWGPEPSVALSYSSGAVDGLTSEVNTQASWVGVGWDFHPGFISRQFDICSPAGYCGGGLLGDLIPDSPDPNLFMLSVGGVSSRLVAVGGGVYRLESDPDWRAQLIADPLVNNGDAQGEYWVVTTPAGVRYTFGKEEVEDSESAFTVPVYDYNGWCAASQPRGLCDKVWQWNLESIEDPNGYRVEFFYEQETNYFLAHTSNVHEDYVRAGHLVRIEYGAGPGKAHHHGRVSFVLGWRCDPGLQECTELVEPTDEQLSDGVLFPDVPVDLLCEATGCTQQAASFFTHRQLAQVITQYWSGSAWVDVDRWDLSYAFAAGPAGQTSPPADPGETESSSDAKLALTQIQKMDVGGSAHLNPVEFDYTWRANRANYYWAHSTSAQYMLRLASFTNELGGVVDVTYGKSSDCIGINTTTWQDWHHGADPWNDSQAANDHQWTYDHNIRRACDEFPGRDPLDGDGWALWNKWKVTQVTLEASGESPAVTTVYEYGDHDGDHFEADDLPTWHHWDHPTRPGESRWSDWRGHRKVTVIDQATGAYTTYTFYQGMKDDDLDTTAPLPQETFLTSDSSTPREDHDWLRGLQAEAHAYTSSGVSLNRTVTYYTWVQTSTAGSWWSAPSQQLGTIWEDGSQVNSRVDYAYVSGQDWFHGLADETRYGFTPSTDVRRTHTSWLQSTLAGREPYWLPNQVSVFDAASGGTEVARTQYLYDAATVYTTRPGRGNLTKTRLFSQLTPSEQYADTQTTFDGNAWWPVKTIDPTGTVTSFDRTNIYGYVESVTVDPDTTSPPYDGLNLVTGYLLDPGRGLPLQVTDPAGGITSYAYDHHGRLEKVWKPTRRSAYPTGDPNYLFAYQLPATGQPVAWVRTRVLSTLNGSAGWVESYVYYDGFGRQIQTQTLDPEGGRFLTSTAYNASGLAEYQSGTYHSSNSPGAGWVDPDWGGSILGPHTRTFYDEQARPTLVETRSATTLLWQGTTEYGVNQSSRNTWVKQIDPEGRWLRNHYNGFGELVLVVEPSGGDTIYDYTPRGELETVINNNNGVTGDGDDITVSLTYDLAGRKKTLSDPDSGVWSYTYNAAGWLATQTDGKGTRITLMHDNAGRVTRRKDTTGTNNITLAVYRYDESHADYGMGRLTSTQSGATAGVADIKVEDYNADGQILGQTWTLDSTAYTASYTYTPDGKTASITYPAVGASGSILAAELVSFGYDGAGRPRTITSAFGSYPYLYATDYTSRNQPSYWQLGGQGSAEAANRTWVYDSLTQRTAELRAGSYRYGTAGQTNLQWHVYTYDDAGLVASLVDNRNSSQRQCYTYNTRGMLTRAVTALSNCTTYDPNTGNSPFDQSYTYDALGNLDIFAGTDQTYGAVRNLPGVADAGPHAVVAAGAVTYSYDDAGNQTRRTESGNNTDYTYNQDNRLTVIDPPTGANWAYTYDADGNRVKVQHDTTTTYHIGGLLEIKAVSGTITETRSIYPLGGGVTATRINTKIGSNWYPTGSDELDFTFADHLGSITAVLEVTTTPTYTRYFQRYYPWGTPRPSYSSGLPTNHTYTGQQADIDGTTTSGLMYYRARYYDPRVGHFTQPDTLIPGPADPQAYNRYQYVRNNPTNGADPSGHGLPNPWALNPHAKEPGWVDWQGGHYLTDGSEPAWSEPLIGVPGASDTVVFMRGTMLGTKSDEDFAVELAFMTGRDVEALTPGENRPDDLGEAWWDLFRCDSTVAPDCSRAESDAEAYRDQILDYANASPSGKVDVVAWSYSAFELSIVLEMYPEIADRIDGVLLLSPTEVRTSAFEHAGIQPIVLWVADDVVVDAPVPWNFGFSRLHEAHSIAGSVPYPLEVPGASVIDRHSAWFGDSYESMSGLLTDLVGGL